MTKNKKEAIKPNEKTSVEKSMDTDMKEDMNKGNKKRFWLDNRGMGTVEVILIIVVLVGLVIIFKSQITEIIESLFQKITVQTNRI